MARNQNNQAVATQDKNLKLRKSIEDRIENYVHNGELSISKDYSPHNALKSAFLILQETKDKNNKSVLETCSQVSIANALLDMTIQGLDPAKKQCYFIAYGQKLICQRSYFGSEAIVKRVAKAKDVNSQCIYEDDEFSYEIKNGRVINLQHKQAFGNREEKKIIGAYCVIEFEDNKPDYIDLMNIDEIKAAWKKGQNYKDDKSNSYHNEFRSEACKKTVINRACKGYINSSSDSSLLIQAFNRTDTELAEDEAQQAISDNANTIDIDEETGEVPETEENLEDVTDQHWEPDKTMTDEEKEAAKEGKNKASELFDQPKNTNVNEEG